MASMNTNNFGSEQKLTFVFTMRTTTFEKRRLKQLTASFLQLMYILDSFKRKWTT